MNEVYAEIITIGDEILYGQILDTNSQWISKQLDDIGVKVSRKYSIPDQSEVIKKAVSESLERSQLVFITGGLGPTKDDLTKNTLSNLFQMPLELNLSALEDVESIFKKFGKELTEINRQQAFLPKGSTKITNDRGTAPGMWFEMERKVVVSMPGVPFEMKSMMSRIILPKIKKQFQLPVILHKVIRTIGIGESWLSEEIARWEDALPSHLSLAYLPGRGQVRLRLTGISDDRDQLELEMESQIKELIPKVQNYVYGFGDLEIEEAIGEMLKEKSLTLATAESCTGGFLAHKITSVPGSSEYYYGSVVAYHNSIKVKELGVSSKIIEKFGAVSEEVAKEMAIAVRKKMNVNVGVSTTGVAGPDGGTDEKPVGTVWIAVADGEKVSAMKIQSSGTRILNIEYSTIKALDFIRQSLMST